MRSESGRGINLGGVLHSGACSFDGQIDVTGSVTSDYGLPRLSSSSSEHLLVFSRSTTFYRVTTPSRFERVFNEHPCGAIRAWPKDNFTLAPPGHFLAKLWALFGPAQPIDNGFEYTLRDRITGLCFCAYSAQSGPRYGGAPADRQALEPVLDAFDAALESIAPVDCRLQTWTESGEVQIGWEHGAALYRFLGPPEASGDSV